MDSGGGDKWQIQDTKLEITQFANDWMWGWGKRGVQEFLLEKLGEWSYHI